MKLDKNFFVKKEMQNQIDLSTSGNSSNKTYKELLTDRQAPQTRDITCRTSRDKNGSSGNSSNTTPTLTHKSPNLAGPKIDYLSSFFSSKPVSVDYVSVPGLNKLNLNSIVSKSKKASTIPKKNKC